MTTMGVRPACQKQHGSGAPLWISQRIGDLALAGDMASVERWRAIAAKPTPSSPGPGWRTDGGQL